MSAYSDSVRRLLGEALGNQVARSLERGSPLTVFGIDVLVDPELPPGAWRLVPSQDIVKLYDMGWCDKCQSTYVVSKWPHRCLPKPGGPR